MKLAISVKKKYIQMIFMSARTAKFTFTKSALRRCQTLRRKSGAVLDNMSASSQINASRLNATRVENHQAKECISVTNKNVDSTSADHA